MRRPGIQMAFWMALCFFACLSAMAATVVSGDFVVTSASQISLPVIITGDATITISNNVHVGFGSLTNDSHTVSIRLESGSSLWLSHLRSINNALTSIHFNGGRLIDAGGWGSYWFITAEGSRVKLVSDNANPIVFSHVNSQWKFYNVGQGRVTTEGAGALHILTDWIVADTRLRLFLSNVETADWGHTGGTYFGRCHAGRNGWIFCYAPYILPKGDIWLGSPDGSAGGVIEMNWQNQRAERIRVVPITLQDPIQKAEAVAYITNDVNTAWGTASLIFEADGSILDAPVYGGVSVVKRGTGSFAIGCNAIPRLVLENGTTTIQPAIPGTDVQIGNLSLRPGAKLIIDGGIVRAGAYNGGDIELRNGGTIVGTLVIAKRTLYDGDAEPLVGSVTKSGAGTLYYIGDTVSGITNLCVAAGSLVFGNQAAGTDNRWWRFTVKGTQAPNNTLQIGPVRLLDANMRFVDGGAGPWDGGTGDYYTLNTGDATSFAPRQYNVSSPNGYSCSVGSPSRIWFSSAVYHCQFDYPKPNPDYPNTWVAWTYRIPDGNMACGYNLKTQWADVTCFPRTWSLESSPTGADGTWELMDEQKDYPNVVNGQKWYNNGGYGTPNNDGWPTNMLHFAQQAPSETTDGGLPATAHVRVEKGATLDCSLVRDGQTVSNLSVDWVLEGGTLKNVRFAPTGAFHLVNVADPKALRGAAIPITFTDASDVANVKNWAVYINGEPSLETVTWRNGGAAITIRETLLILR